MYLDKIHRERIMYKSLTFFYFCVVIFMTIVIEKGANSFSLSGTETKLGEEDVRKPFGDCESHTIGKDTPSKRFYNGASFAFYPITDEATTLYLKISIGKTLYKVSLEGTLMTLEKCSMMGQNCSNELVAGVKTSDYIIPHQWNQVSAALNTKKISIMVNSREVMAMENFEQKDLDGAKWRVASVDKADSDLEGPEILYLAQFKCKDDDVIHSATKKHRSEIDFGDEDPNSDSAETEDNFYSSPAPHSDVSSNSENSPKSSYDMMIVGVVIGIIVLVTLGVILYQVYKKRQSANISLRNGQQST